MTQEILKSSGDSLLVLSVGSGVITRLGWLEWVNQYAPALGFFAALIFGCVGIYFHIRATKSDKLSQDNERSIALLKRHIKELNKSNTDKG